MEAWEALFPSNVDTNNGLDASSLSKSVFDGVGDRDGRVQLFGEPRSIVWQHGTLYTLQVDQRTDKPDVKNRASVKWRPVGSPEEKPEKVVVFVRPYDWRPSEPRYVLKAETGDPQTGWRTFAVSVWQQRPRPRAKRERQQTDEKEEHQNDMLEELRTIRNLVDHIRDKLDKAIKQCESLE
jgi:hypothetical protein